MSDRNAFNSNCLYLLIQENEADKPGSYSAGYADSQNVYQKIEKYYFF